MGTDNTNKNNLKIFKFGGASVKNADAVRNVASILKRYENEKLIVVISAMGKTTNSLELIHQARFHKQNYKSELQKLKTYHFEIANELFGESSEHLNPLHNQFDASGRKTSRPVLSKL
jgi:aspartate kinase